MLGAIRTIHHPAPRRRRITIGKPSPLSDGIVESEWSTNKYVSGISVKTNDSRPVTGRVRIECIDFTDNGNRHSFYRRWKDHTNAVELKKKQRNNRKLRGTYKQKLFISRDRLCFSINMFGKQLFVWYETSETFINHTTKTVTFYVLIILANLFVSSFGNRKKNRFFYVRSLFNMRAAHIKANWQYVI